ncbi:hypothetical protein AU196_22655 [Mycobacterium sp. IS-1742]|uniref:YncE family protein n=1 Tax=Mycobacterium sp. IS-1742 TaxID=1772285 RepID=UPI00073FCEF1|nr:hypothetical protein [Mycobacterium sp. IS-1742]KUI25607.1 hypothetical protein AU196_22655 [Mycobacterium sp. IS-1742]
MAGQHSARRTKANGRGRHRRYVEPYKWLGAGAVALGLGVAVANGSGVAHADDGAPSTPPSSSSQDKPGGDSAPGDDAGPSVGNDDSNDADADTDDIDDSVGNEDDEDDETLDDDDTLDDEDDAGDLGVDTATETATTQRALTLVDETSEPELEVVAEEVPAVDFEPVIAETPVSAPLPELSAPVGVNTGPEVPGPPAAPTLSELVVAAYRPTNQRGLTTTPASVQTTGQSAPADPPRLAAAATPSGVIDRIPLGNGLPYTVVAGPDGRTVYVITTTMSAGGGALLTSTVYGIDTRTNRPVGTPLVVGYVAPQTFATSAKPIAFSPDGRRVYVSSMDRGADGQVTSRVVVIDAATGRAAGDAIDLGNAMTTGLVVSPDGRRLYTANGNSTVTVIDLQHNNTPVATVPIGIFAGPSSGGFGVDIVISQNDAQTVYVTDFAERAVYVLDPATNAVNPDPILIDGNPVSLALSPDGSRLFVNAMSFTDPLGSPTNQSTLVVVNTATKAIVGTPISYGSVAEGPATNGMTLVSPNGRYVYTESFALTPGATPSGTLWKIDTVNGTAQALLSGVYPSAPVMSADGTRLYVPAVAVVDGEPHLAIGAVSAQDGAMLTRIPIDAGTPMGIALSANGSRIYLGQLLVGDGGDPTSLTGQLAVIDTGTSNSVTPPRAVNPITRIVRGVTNAGRASAQAIAHALERSVTTIGRLVQSAREIALADGNSHAEVPFWNDLGTGFSIAGLVDDISNFLTDNLVRRPIMSAVLGVGNLAFGLRDMIVGHASNDPGRELSGLIDTASVIVARVSAPIAIAAQLAKLYASFWVPIGNSEQTAFLNHISQCYFKKNADQLNSGQAKRITDRYSGGWGLANLLSDHSLYKTKGFWNFVGQSGCP